MTDPARLLAARDRVRVRIAEGSRELDGLEASLARNWHPDVAHIAQLHRQALARLCAFDAALTAHLDRSTSKEP